MKLNEIRDIQLPPIEPEKEDADAYAHVTGSAEYDEEIQIDDYVKVVYPNEFEGQVGVVTDKSDRSGFITVEFKDGRSANMHESDVDKVDENDWDKEFDDWDEETDDLEY